MYPENRRRFLDQLGERDAAAVVPSGSLVTRNADCEHRFRPESDFRYLTGFAEPDSVLVLAPHREDGRAVLFLRERDPAKETWSGRRLGVEAAPDALSVDEAYPIEALWDVLPELLTGHRDVVYRSGTDAARDAKMIAALADLRLVGRRGEVAPESWIEPTATLHELRLRKTAPELERMRRANAISAEAHLAAMEAASAGTNEAELDALLDYTFRRRGCTGAAYTNIVAGGANACILHYIENDRPLRDGDLLLIDAGGEWDYYASDVTRTFPVGGTFSDEQRALYELVLRAQKAGIDGVRPGGTMAAVHATVVELLVDGLLELGLLAGDRAEILSEKRYERFYMHKTGHWLGLDVHDCGALFVDGEPRPFEPGMVTTVEPGLYVGPDDETVETRWRGIGIRIEDDVVVTADGNENLTAAVPKEVDEVEAACRGATLQAVGSPAT